MLIINYDAISTSMLMIHYYPVAISVGYVSRIRLRDSLPNTHTPQTIFSHRGHNKIAKFVTVFCFILAASTRAPHCTVKCKRQRGPSPLFSLKVYKWGQERGCPLSTTNDDSLLHNLNYSISKIKVKDKLKIRSK